MVFLLRGYYPRALHYLNLDRGSDFAKALSIDMLVRQGKEQEALELGSPPISQWAGYDILLANLQHKPEPEISEPAGKVQASDDPETNYLSAGHLAYAGYPDTAMRMLREAIKGNYCSYPAMEFDPMFSTLRAQPGVCRQSSGGYSVSNNFLSQR